MTKREKLEEELAAAEDAGNEEKAAGLRKALTDLDAEDDSGGTGNGPPQDPGPTGP